MGKGLKRFVLAAKIVAIVVSLCFGIISVGGSIMIANEAAINRFFNIETSRIEEIEGAENIDSYYYKSSLQSVAAVRANAQAYVEAIMEEGATLVKNEDEALPLGEGAKVSLFSVSSVEPAMTGTGSSGNDNLSPSFVDLKTAFEDAGMSVNDALWNWYVSNKGAYLRKASGTWGAYFTINDAAWNNIPEAAKNNGSYGDAAIFILSRRSGEGRDMASYYGNKLVNKTNDMTNGNYLALSPNEISVLKGLKELKDAGVYRRIVVVMNSANPVQCDFADDPAYGVDALLWCGTLGDTGAYAVANLLAGKKNFSGRLSDTFWKYHYKNPVNANFGPDAYHLINQTTGSFSSVETSEGVQKTWTSLAKTNAGDSQQKQNMMANSRSTVYAEGIYVGYRYTETRYEDVVTGRSGAGDFDYYDTVSYPFGYGLSYTKFSYSDFTMSRAQQDGETVYRFSVKVTNTGDRAGKEVVQLYLQKPYTQYDITNGIEKAAVELVDFTKTKELEPGKSETVTMSVKEGDLACYDASAAKTYILERGDYFFTVGKDAHDAVNNILKYKDASCETEAFGNTGFGKRDLVKAQTISDTDDKTYSVSRKALENHISDRETEITNQFEKADILYYDGATNGFEYVTRSDWEGTVKLGFDGEGKCLYNQVAVTVTEEMFEDRKAAMTDPEPDNTAYPTYGTENGTHYNLIDLRAYTDGDADPTNDKWIPYDDPMWDRLLDQLTWAETKEFLSNGWRLTMPISSINKPQTIDYNGSVGIVSTYNSYSSINNGLAKKTSDPDASQRITFYPCNGVSASTFNKELMEWYGKEWGEESLWSGVNGLYGMGINLHRSPYGGRNFEYFSEDPFLMGTIAAQITKGAATRGHYMYLKHAIMNDQETYRIGGYVWANEQTIREIYLKPFRIAIEEGGASNIMTAEPALGVNWAGSQGYINNVLRAEYGMTGFAVSDYLRDTDGNYVQGLLGGNDLPDGTFNSSGQENTIDAFKNLTETSGHGEVARAMRDATHRILYTVVHSNAMNGVSANTRVIVLTPAWIGAVQNATEAVKWVFIAGMVMLGAAVVCSVLSEIRNKNKGKEKKGKEESKS